MPTSVTAELGTIDFTADAGDITTLDGRTIQSATGNISLHAKDNVNLSKVTTTADAIITADSDSDNSGAVTDN